jgi:hypothetical protein
MVNFESRASFADQPHAKDEQGDRAESWVCFDSHDRRANGPKTSMWPHRPMLNPTKILRRFDGLGNVFVFGCRTTDVRVHCTDCNDDVDRVFHFRSGR